MPELTRSWTYPLRRRGTALLTWWIRELLSLVPAPLRRALGGAPRRLILTLEGGEVVLTRQSDQDPEPVGRYPLTAAEVAGKPLGSLRRDCFEATRRSMDHEIQMMRELNRIAEIPDPPRRRRFRRPPSVALTHLLGPPRRWSLRHRHAHRRHAPSRRSCRPSC